MQTRLNMQETVPTGYRALFPLENYLKTTEIEPLHKELIKMRASQINGCAFCLNMHSKEARALGETEQRLYGLSAWKESPFYSDKEKAILALTEEVTCIANGGVSDATYNNAITLLGQKVTAEVIMAVIAINAWNRIGIATHLLPPLD